VVDRIITDLAVIDVQDGGLVLREVAPATTVAAVIAATEGRLSSDPRGVGIMRPPC
jgi:3-oxoacid CoA-transferase subunit B